MRRYESLVGLRMQERAMCAEKTIGSERATKAQKTNRGERAMKQEKTNQNERANKGEKTIVDERAMDGKKTNGYERANRYEKTSKRERAMCEEKTITHKRAMKVKKPNFEERHRKNGGIHEGVEPLQQTNARARGDQQPQASTVVATQAAEHRQVEADAARRVSRLCRALDSALRPEDQTGGDCVGGER